MTDGEQRECMTCPTAGTRVESSAAPSCAVSRRREAFRTRLWSRVPYRMSGAGTLLLAQLFALLIALVATLWGRAFQSLAAIGVPTPTGPLITAAADPFVVPALQVGSFVILFGSWIAALALARHRTLRVVRARLLICPHCGHDLRQLPFGPRPGFRRDDGKCPECGQPFRLPVLRRVWRHERRLVRAWRSCRRRTLSVVTRSTVVSNQRRSADRR